MTDQIAQNIVQAISPIVPVFYSEAETESYPYAVYSYSPVFYRTKDEIYKIAATDVEVHVYGPDYDILQAKQDQIISALAALTGDQFTVRVRSTISSRTEGVWDLTSYYSIIQKF